MLTDSSKFDRRQKNRDTIRGTNIEPWLHGSDGNKCQIEMESGSRCTEPSGDCLHESKKW